MNDEEGSFDIHFRIIQSGAYAGEDEGLAPLSAAQLANQATLVARRHVGQYYDGFLRSDDELHAVQTRNVALR